VVATLAHELNQPLTAISNYMEAARALLDRGGNLPLSRIGNAIDRAGEQAVRAGQIIQRLRGFLSHGNSERQIEAVSPLVKESVELALFDMGQRGVSIRLGCVPVDVSILADKVQIQQVLLNLLRNAAEAVAHQECREITLITEANAATLQISVVDNGPGLPDEVRDKLFQPFVSTKRTGMGIGLSICHTIITAHGGHLWAEPNPDGGTIFRFTLSIAPASDPADG
jgi:two-component system, LuxR family, sensor kinase FixL